MQCLRLNETCRMIGYSFLSNDVNFVEIGIKRLRRKTTFWCFPMRISPTKSTFLRKKFGGTIHPCEKNEPTLDHSGGGVHGKVCWLITYKHVYKLLDILMCWSTLKSLRGVQISFLKPKKFPRSPKNLSVLWKYFGHVGQQIVFQCEIWCDVAALPSLLPYRYSWWLSNNINNTYIEIILCFCLEIGRKIWH